MLYSFMPKLQAQLDVGMKAGVNLSDFWVSESVKLESSMKTGFSFGNFFRYQYRDSRGVEADILFRYQNSEMKDFYVGKTYDCHFLSVELPIYNMIQAEINQNMLFFGYGLFTSFGIISRFKSEKLWIDPYKKSTTNNKVILYRWNYGVGLILGYELASRLQFNLNYQLGFRNVIDDDSDRGSMITRLMELGIGYRF